MNFEEPILPPEGEGMGNRYESASVDIEELRKFLEDTKFENEEAVHDMLSARYHMHQRENIQDIALGMTRRFQIPPDMKERLMRGETIDLQKISTPLSGQEPEEVLALEVSALSGETFNLRIFEVYNRNQHYRFEYTLDREE